MKVTSQMVKELQKRIDVTYEEAERVLLRTNGNIDRAEELMNKQQNSGLSRLMDEIARIYKELLTYYLKITRKDKTMIDIPLVVIVGLYLIMTVDSKIWVGIVSIGIILISESSLNIYKVTKDEERIVRTASKIQDAESEPTEESVLKDVPTPPKVGRVQTTNKEDDGDDYYEITIEK